MIVSILIGIGAVGMVIGVAINGYLKKKRGERGCSCGNCTGCCCCEKKPTTCGCESSQLKQDDSQDDK